MGSKSLSKGKDLTGKAARKGGVTSKAARKGVKVKPRKKYRVSQGGKLINIDITIISNSLF
jgi:hypothetical protein